MGRDTVHGSVAFQKTRLHLPQTPFPFFLSFFPFLFLFLLFPFSFSSSALPSFDPTPTNTHTRWVDGISWPRETTSIRLPSRRNDAPPPPSNRFVNSTNNKNVLCARKSIPFFTTWHLIFFFFFFSFSMFRGEIRPRVGRRSFRYSFLEVFGVFSTGRYVQSVRYL